MLRLNGMKQRMNAEEIWRIVRGEGPVVAAAIHDGHAVRAEVAELLALSDAERLREEDPFSGAWTEVAPTRIIGLNSRFEVDLNRPRETAVYRVPDDAWGLTVWKEPLPPDVMDRSLGEYDAFYAAVRDVLDDVQARHGQFVVYDLHTYNHRRGGPDAAPAAPAANPEVNIGTGTMDRSYWAPVVERFMRDLQAFDFAGRQLDVRENVKFKGGGFGKWIHEHYPQSGCAMAIEFKKFFMDECTGELCPEHHAAIQAALRSTVPGVLEALGTLDPGS